MEILAVIGGVTIFILSVIGIIAICAAVGEKFD